MPKIAIYKYLVFFIVSYDLRERYHVHVANTKSMKSRIAKIWLDPVEVFAKGNLSQAEINVAVKLLERNADEIKNKIRNFAEGRRFKPLSLKLK